MAINRVKKSNEAYNINDSRLSDEFIGSLATKEYVDDRTIRLYLHKIAIDSDGSTENGSMTIITPLEVIFSKEDTIAVQITKLSHVLEDPVLWLKASCINSKGLGTFYFCPITKLKSYGNDSFQVFVINDSEITTENFNSVTLISDSVTPYPNLN